MARLFDGIAYPLTFRITPGADNDGNPSESQHMVSVDLELPDGTGITGRAETPDEAFIDLLAAMANFERVSREAQRKATGE